MKTITMSIFDCKPGMKIAETIHNNYGAIMLTENTILDKQAINRIDSMGISQIKVFEQDSEEIKSNYNKNVQQKYEDNINDIKNIMSRIAVGSSIDMSKVRKVAGTISTDVYSNRDIVNVLNELREAGEYTYTHSINVSFISMMIGKWMNCSERTIKHLIQAGLLHDIGKYKVPQEIIMKPGKLTQAEFEQVKKHPLHAYSMLRGITTIHEDVLYGVLMHHEREDGTGYPTGVKSDKINIIAKILAVADIYDAMTSERIYRKRQSPFEVFRLMQNDSYGKLHPLVLDTFINHMSMYYIGMEVRLSNGAVGEVVFINPRHISQPIVKVGDEYIDLTKNTDLKIEEMLCENITNIA